MRPTWIPISSLLRAERIVVLAEWDAEEGPINANDIAAMAGHYDLVILAMRLGHDILTGDPDGSLLALMPP